MCFADKRKRNWIRKKDRVSNPVWPPGRVGYGGTSRHSVYIYMIWFIYEMINCCVLIVISMHLG